MWVATGERIKGNWAELIANRAIRQFAGRLEISYDITVGGDTYTGIETVHSYDVDGNLTASPSTPAQLVGKRLPIP